VLGDKDEIAGEALDDRRRSRQDELGDSEQRDRELPRNQHNQCDHRRSYRLGDEPQAAAPPQLRVVAHRW
jgi:hypothetical protein